MTTVATETEKALMITNRSRLASIVAHARRGSARDYLFGAGILAITAFLTTLGVLAATR